MSKKDLIIVLGGWEYAELFKKFNHQVETSVNHLISEPDRVAAVVFSGGADVHPSFYGGVDNHNLCYTNPSRDRSEQAVFKFCQRNQIKLSGICRGLQFLNVMAGGFMYHHITDHAISHLHEVFYPFSGEMVPTNSFHHQLVGLPKEGAIPIAWAVPKRSRIYVWPDGEATATIKQQEIEAAIFPKYRAMGVQYHPEMMDRRSFGRIHYESMFRDFLELSITKFTEKYGRKSDDGQRSVRQAGSSD